MNLLVLYRSPIGQHAVHPDRNETVRKKGRASGYNFSSSAYRMLLPQSRVPRHQELLQDLQSTPELSEQLNEGLTEALGRRLRGGA